MRGLVAKVGKDYDLAERLFNDALAMYRELKSDSDISRTLNSVGNLEHARKAYDAAERYFREALEMDQQRDDRSAMAMVLGNLAELAVDRWGEAREWGERGLPVAREVGLRYVIAVIAHVLARVHVAGGRPDLALPLAQEAVEVYERIRHPDLAQAKNLLGVLKGR